MRTLRNRFFVGLLILTPVAAVFADAVTLLEDGRAACTIVAGHDDGMSVAYTMLYTAITNVLPSNVLREAAADLAFHLNEMGGIWNPAHQVIVVDEAAQARTPYRVLLGSAAIEEYGLADEAARIPYPGYVYRVIDNDLLIFGSSSKGTANGVYGFLQDELGVRWFGPQELFKVVPRQETVKIGPLDKQVEPSFLGRLVHVEARIEQPAYLWGRRRMRMSEARDEGEPFRNTSHNIYRIFPAARYWASNPEYYALRGQRRQNAADMGANFAVCWSNPDVVKIAANAALSHFSRNKNHHSFALGINDANAYCDCAECAKLQPRRYFKRSIVASDMYFHFVNEVARRVKEEFPDRYLGVIAYNDVTAPPLAEVEDNVHVVLVNDISEYFDASYRAWDEELVAAWEKKGITMGLYYYTQLAKLVPAYFPKLLAQELKDKHARGYQSVTSESGNGWPWHGPMAYVEMRLLWDVGLEVDELLDDYFTSLYGGAAEYMQEMYELFEDIHMRPRGGRFLGEHYDFSQFHPYTAEDLARIRKLLASAHKALQGLGTRSGTIERLQEQRLAYTGNGLRVFLDMLEGYALAKELQTLPRSLDSIDMMEALEKIRRVNTLTERHETVYREAIVQDEYLPRRFRGDTATPVRNRWKGLLSAAAGDALADIYRRTTEGHMLLDERVQEKLQKEVTDYRTDPLREYMFKVKTNTAELGPNTVPNAGFEEVWGAAPHTDIPDGFQPGFPYGWSRTPGVIESGGIISTVEHEHEGDEFGRRAAVIQNTGGKTYLLMAAGKAAPGEAFLCSVHAKLDLGEARVEANPSVQMLARWRNKEGAWMRGDDFVVELTQIGAWSLLETVALAPENAGYIHVFLLAENLRDEPKVFFDNVSVQLIQD